VPPAAARRRARAVLRRAECYSRTYTGPLHAHGLSCRSVLLRFTWNLGVQMHIVLYFFRAYPVLSLAVHTWRGGSHSRPDHPRSGCGRHANPVAPMPGAASGGSSDPPSSASPASPSRFSGCGSTIFASIRSRRPLRPDLGPLCRRLLQWQRRHAHRHHLRRCSRPPPSHRRRPGLVGVAQRRRRPSAPPRRHRDRATPARTGHASVSASAADAAAEGPARSEGWCRPPRLGGVASMLLPTCALKQLFHHGV
jgi:hypothetical protein